MAPSKLPPAVTSFSRSIPLEYWPIDHPDDVILLFSISKNKYRASPRYFKWILRYYAAVCHCVFWSLTASVWRL